ncbi:MAG TPA: VCBS repeat-containing protein, partial [Planctomycetaceae bacterium]|nr:VCBS repeat-containing protein [Planctomycetaceae bacterium]
LPVFKPGVKIGPGFHNVRVSYVEGNPVVLQEMKEYTDFRKTQYQQPTALKVNTDFMNGRKTRARQWHRTDLNGDGKLDVLLGIGDWTEYGWDDAWDSNGVWKNGPLRGRMHVAYNEGTNEKPKFAHPVLLASKNGPPPEVFGWPSPCIEDWDGDGDLDIICGEFRDTFTYFENVGSKSEPLFAAGRQLLLGDKPLTMDLQMIVPTSIDWDADGDLDLIVGDEDGRVALIENTGKFSDGEPQFLAPKYFQQEAEFVKFGALATPFGFDWDGDGDEDILCGNTAGYIGFIENLGGGESPRWAKPKYLEAGGEVFRIMAGPNGSIQGPCESKWGYTTISVADWNHDGLPDILFNSIWGRIEWLENIGTRTNPKLAKPQSIEVEWDGPTPKPEWTWWEPQGKELVTQWRTTPFAVDWNDDGLIDLVMLDTEGYLALFERVKQGDRVVLIPGKRIFVDLEGNPLQLNPKRAGGSGRRKFEIVDWDGDGLKDLMINGTNADLWLNRGERDGRVIFEEQGPLDERKLAGHTSSPTTVDWNNDKIPDLLIGAEDGYFYHVKNPRSTTR